MDTPEPIEFLQNLKIKKYDKDWKPFMEKYDCQKICELGVFEGKNFELMIEHEPELAVAVDAWINDGTASRNDTGYSQEELDKLYKNFADKMKGKPFVQIHREYTVDAAEHFPDQYFDIVYVDADHSYDGCLADMRAWYPKVKRGKFLVGDDYRKGYTSRTKVKIGVIKAVQEFANANNLKVYKVLQNGWAIIKKQ